MKQHPLSALELSLFADVAYDFTHICYDPLTDTSVLIPSYVSDVAFSRENAVETRFRLQSVHSLVNTEFATFWDEVGKHLILAFRGTAGAEDVADVAALKPVPWQALTERAAGGAVPGAEGVTVYEGFARQYDDARREIYSILDGYVSTGIKKLSICGHSLGGALTTLAALDLSLRYPQLETLDATIFGSPRVGNKQLTALDRGNRVGQTTLRLANLCLECANRPHITILGIEACRDKVSLVPPADGPSQYDHVVAVTLLPLATDEFKLKAGPGFELKMHSTSYEESIYTHSTKKNEQAEGDL